LKADRAVPAAVAGHRYFKKGFYAGNIPELYIDTAGKVQISRAVVGIHNQERK